MKSAALTIAAFVVCGLALAAVLQARQDRDEWAMQATMCERVEWGQRFDEAEVLEP